MPRTRTTLTDDLAAARAVIPILADQASDLFARIREPGLPSRLPGWSAGDVAVHLGMACTAYAASASGDFAVLDKLRAVGAAGAEQSPAPDFDALMAALPSPAGIQERIAELNTLTLAQSGPDAPLSTPARIRAGAEAIVAASARRDPAEPCPVPWFGADVQVPLGTVVGLFLSETLLHTLDAARASHQKWPIPPGTARLIIALVFPEMMPRTVNRERAARMHAVVHLHIRGGITIALDLDGGLHGVVRDPGPGRADCHISMDPVGFLLAVSGRASQNRQIAYGRMIPYGRKPWLAPQVARLFSYP